LSRKSSLISGYESTKNARLIAFSGVSHDVVSSPAVRIFIADSLIDLALCKRLPHL